MPATQTRASVAFRHKLDTYGITREQYEAMLNEQGGVCAICGLVPTNSKGFHVDHDHATNTVRGLLCSTCNTGIGGLRDDINLLRKAIEYLQHRSTDIS